MGTDGLEPPTSRMWTVQTAKRENGVSNVILPEVELFKVQRLLWDPWGLICSAAANQTINAKYSISLLYNQPASCQEGAQKAWFSAPGYLPNLDLGPRLSTGGANNQYSVILDCRYEYQFWRGYVCKNDLNVIS